MAVSIEQALDQVFGGDSSARVIHWEEVAAGAPLIPAAQIAAGKSVEDVPTIGHSAIVVKFFIRTSGVAPEKPHPTAGCDVGMEVWLPQHNSWNNRVRCQIAGGFAGDFAVTSKEHFGAKVCSDLESGQMAGDLGYVVSTTNAGHIADTVEHSAYLLNQDGSPNTEGWKNVAWQATHLLGLKTKALAAAYYGKPAKYSYIFGCSTGGRAAYHSAQKFPEDFDGILVGCPSISQSHLFPSLMHPLIVINNDLAGVGFQPKQLDMVSRAALAHGDTSITGQHDGYFTTYRENTYDPTKDPNVLSVAGGGKCTEPWALSLAQARAVNKIWYGPTWDGACPDPAVDNGTNEVRTANQLWWGKLRGVSILFAGEARLVASGHLALAYADRTLAPPAWKDPNNLNQNAWNKWTYRQFAEAIMKCEEMDKYWEGMDANDPDLRRVQKTGAKILAYHALGDQGVAPQSAIKYYMDSAEITGGLEKTKEFHRLFLIPGMGHCFRHPGVVGEASIPIPPLETMFGTLVDWVEKDKKPDFMLADSVDGKSSRPIYAWPNLPKYDGHGDVQSASSFSTGLLAGKHED